MLCLKVSVNGQLFCVAGVGDHGGMSAFVNWVYIDDDKGGSQLLVQPGDVLLNVSGFKSDMTPVHWGDIAHHINVGDKVTIEVVELETADPPIPTPMHPETSE